MGRTFWMVTMIASGALLAAACGDDGADPRPADPGPTTPTTPTDPTGPTAPALPCDRLVDAAGAPVACVMGRLIDEDGAPITGLKVSACTPHTCIIGDSGADGRYRIGGLPTEPHKLEVFGQLRGYATIIFFQPTTPGLFTTPPGDIVMPQLVDPPSPWPNDTGGTVTLAGGMLELTAGPGSLRYPLGTVDKEVIGVEVDPEDLPPYDLTPWVGRENGTRAFYVNPFPMHALEPIGLVIHGAADVPAGARYAVYMADHLEALLERAGDAVADGAGRIVLEEDAELTMLTTIILVPEL